MSEKQTIRVEITSDHICPWCFVGKRNFELALKDSSASPYKFEVSYKPFYLSTDIPAQGVPLQQYLNEKYGNFDPRRHDHLRDMGKAVGINFLQDRNIYPTRESHRLVEFAKKQGKEGPVTEAIYHAYFEEGRNIIDHNVLAAIGKEAGLYEQDVKDYLATDEGKSAVESMVLDAHKKRIHGVPHFIISSDTKRTQLSGAQPPEVFLQAFQKVA